MSTPAWSAPTARHPVDGVVELPGSKSLTNRYLVLAGLAAGPSRLRGPLRSRDTLLMAGGLAALGVSVTDEGDDWLITPGPLTGPATIDCGLAGTVMRFLPPVAGLAVGDIDFDGDPRARARPMAPLLDALRHLGVKIDESARGLPFTVHGTGHVSGGEVSLDSSASSQFVSGLLLAAARYEGGLTVRHVGPALPSEPHVTMTVELLRECGVEIDDSRPDEWRVVEGIPAPLDVTVEPDLSNAAPFLAAALATGGRVRIPGWPQRTTQAGDALRDILDAMGADVLLDQDGLTVTGGDGISGLDVDLHDAGELAPVVVALAALADAPSRVSGIRHLRGHETDRLAALATEINRLGGQVIEGDDELVIHPRPLHGGQVNTYDDHRLAMAAAVLGLAVPGILVSDVETTGKTLPGFVERWQAMLASAGG
jgi:3-phosphoshikimate 1-carboxyvinyltransferase